MLKVEKHAKYFERVLTLIPEEYASSHLALIYFCVLGLALLRRIDDRLRGELLSYVRSLKVADGSGFRLHISHSPHEPPNTSAAFFALSICLMVNGELPEWLDPDLIASSLRRSQTSTGTFSAMPDSRGESSLRHSYSAVAALRILGRNLEPAAAQRLASFIISTRDPVSGGLGDAPGALSEGHAGFTFCGLACLRLIDCEYIRQEEITAFLCRRQFSDGGFNGRANKPRDACYSFWTLAALSVLGQADLVDVTSARRYLLETSQDHVTGGFSKIPTLAPPDPLHSALALAALSILGQPELAPIDPLLNVTIYA